jgi:CBS domain-containing protein
MQHNIGSLVVLDRDQVAGIFTERDVLHRVVAEGRDPARTTVAEALTREVFCCTPDTPLEEVRSAFMTRRLRHLPVVDAERRLIGVISIGDLNAHLVADQEVTIFGLREYLYGRV